jgi:hypothetical protein
VGLVDKVALGQVSSEYFCFLRQFSLHQMLHTHLLSGIGAIGQLVADVPNEISLTPPQETKKKNMEQNIGHKICFFHIYDFLKEFFVDKYLASYAGIMFEKHAEIMHIVM